MMMRLSRLLFLLVLPFGLAAAARAQSVRWELADMPNAVQLVFENCTPEGDPQLPAIKDVKFTYVGRTEGFQASFNGGFTNVHVLGLVFLVSSRQNNAVQIPAFNIKTDKGVMKVAAFNASAGASGP